MRKKIGFTLIELMVTISISGLLFGIGVAKYNDFNNRQTLKQAALDLKNNLILARNNVMSGVKDAGSCGSTPLSGWKVDFKPSTRFWGIDGKYDSECKNSSVNSTNAFTSCVKSVCANTNCWSSNGSTCDSGCGYSSVNSASVYTNCNRSACGGGNCFSTDGINCDSGCSFGSVNSAIVSSSCISYSCANWAWKNGDRYCGSFSWCCDPGSWCAKYGCVDWVKTGPGGFDWVSVPCQWTCIANCGKTGYALGGWGITYKYTGSGSCGNPFCYKLTNCGSYYTGSFLGVCGASSCSSGTFCDSFQSCHWVSAKYSSSVSGLTNKYSGSGSCNSNGTGPCYKLTNGGTYYTSGSSCSAWGGCSSGTYYNTYSTCSFLTALYSYTASKEVTKWAGSGSCSVDGSGNCYKLTGQKEYYTGNGPCGSTDCPKGFFYDSSLSCKFYDYGAAGTIYQIAGVCGSTVFKVKTYSLPGNGKIVITNLPETITFKPVPSYGVDQASDICLFGFNKYYKISVSSKGEIIDYGLVATCP